MSSVRNPQNFRLGDLHLSAESISKNTPLDLQTEVLRTVPEDERAISASIINADGNPQPCAINHCQSQFRLNRKRSTSNDSLEQGTHQGFVRIAGEDSLAADTRRFFTVEVRPPWKVLVVASAANRLFARAIFFNRGPCRIRVPPHGSGAIRLRCDFVRRFASQGARRLRRRLLARSAAAIGYRLAGIAGTADRGGGVAIWLGRDAEPKGHSVDEFEYPLPHSK